MKSLERSPSKHELYKSFRDYCVGYEEDWAECQKEHLGNTKSEIVKSISKSKPTLSPVSEALLSARAHYTKLIKDEITRKIHPIGVKIVDAGSDTAKSDIDLNVMVDISDSRVNADTFKTLMDTADTIRKSASCHWEIPGLSLDKTLDINIYPPTILHMSKTGSLGSLKDYVLRSGDTVCLIPTLSTPELIKNFIVQDYRYIMRSPKTDLNGYSNAYKYNVIPSLMQILSLKNINISDEAHRQSIASGYNSHIHKMIDANSIGPEMYFGISTIIYVVWHMQLKNHVDPKILSILAIGAYIENCRLYKRTQKQKYALRANHARANMQSAIKYLDSTNAEHKAILSMLDEQRKSDIPCHGVKGGGGGKNRKKRSVRRRKTSGI